MKMPIATVGALIFASDQSVLLIKTHKWHDRWSLPGGKIDWGEPMEKALKREIREETGLRIHKIEFACIQESIHAKEFYRDTHMLLINYFARASSKNVRLNDEAQDFVWLLPKKALRLALNKPTRNLIRLFL